jgi:Uma2 family endonuclease
MTPASATSPDERTFADILRDLGNLPAGRVVWLPRVATEDDVVDARRRELVDGFLVGKAVAFWKGVFEVAVGTHLMNWVHPRRLGAVTIAFGPCRVAPGVVRCPDVAFITWDRLLDADRRIPDIAPAAPDLVVEMPLPDQPPAELARKRREFFAAGTRLLWDLRLPDRTAIVYTGPTERTVLTTADTLTGDPVLPGFALPLADLFDDPQLNPRPSTNPGG